MVAPNAIQKVSSYMRSDSVKERFAEVVGSHNAGSYISSALLAVASSPKLQECRMESIYLSAMRAATLRLSVDPGTGEAYLVPYGGNATLIVGYKGLYDMAVRTGKYRYINTGRVYEGEIVEEERISGFHSITGKAISKKTIGWIAAFEMNPERGQRYGLAKTLYMTKEEIHEHARKYSKSYSFKDSGWQTDPEAMERKTVLRLILRRWGYLDPADMTVLRSIEAEPDSIDAEYTDAPIPQEMKEIEKRSEAQLLQELGYGEAESNIPDMQENPDPINDTAWDTWLALCNRAEKVNVKYPLIDREKYTLTELKPIYNSIKADVDAAEKKSDKKAQAKS